MSNLKKITILNFDLSDNSLGRAYILAQALSVDYDVKIVGPARKGEIWEPLRNSDIKMIQLPHRKFPRLFCEIPSILKAIDGDLIYAVKPRFTSFGFGIVKKFFSKTPLMLDIDDWEIGFYLKKKFWSRLLKFMNLANPNGLFWTWVMQFFIPYADGITTVSTFLQNKFGGEIIPHAKDTAILDPKRFKNNVLKKQLGISGKRVVMFLGTPRAHKGVEDALKAVLMIGDPNVIMLIVGANLAGDYEKSLTEMGGDSLLMIGKIPLGDVPRYLMLADIVVIPQRQSPDTVGQLPSKLFDAMAMARSIISTRVSDIPQILGNCGIIVNPETVEGMSRAIKWILDNPEQAAHMGMQARLRCVELYSLASIRKKAAKLVKEVARQ